MADADASSGLIKEDNPVATAAIAVGLGVKAPPSFPRDSSPVSGSGSRSESGVRLIRCGLLTLKDILAREGPEIMQELMQHIRGATVLIPDLIKVPPSCSMLLYSKLCFVFLNKLSFLYVLMNKLETAINLANPLKVVGGDRRGDRRAAGRAAGADTGESRRATEEIFLQSDCGRR